MSNWPVASLSVPTSDVRVRYFRQGDSDDQWAVETYCTVDYYETSISSLKFDGQIVTIIKIMIEFGA